MKATDFLNPTNAVNLYEAGTAVHLRGAPGSAKSHCIREYPKILSRHYGIEFGYLEHLIPTIDAIDVRGMMVPVKLSDGTTVCKYLRPGLLPPPEYFEKYPRGILLGDEFESGDELTKKAFGPVILEGKFGDFELPEGWQVMAASNRVSDKSGAGKPMMHLINRTRQIEWEIDVQGWLNWATNNDVHPMIMAFVNRKPGLFATEVPAEAKPFCTQRSLTSAARLINRAAGTDSDGNASMHVPDGEFVRESVAGDIGEGMAAEFFAFTRVIEFLPTVKEIIKNPAGAKLPPEERLDAAFAAMQMCVHSADAKNVDPLWQYIIRLPKELQVASAKQMLDKSGGVLLNSKALGQWVSQNKALVMASTS